MKFYSERTQKLYDSQADLEKAEAEIDNKKNQREARAKAVEAAITKAQESAKQAHELLVDFCKDYGAYHTSISHPEDLNILNVFDWLL